MRHLLTSRFSAMLFGAAFVMICLSAEHIARAYTACIKRMRQPQE